jgi:hypothetical protein
MVENLHHTGATVMAGPRVGGWDFYELAIDNFKDVQVSLPTKQLDQDTATVMTNIGLQNLASGIERSIQELYERMQRLHQKVDRLEEKIGSVPKK